MQPVRIPLSIRQIQQPLVWSLVYFTITAVGLLHYIQWTSPVFLMGVFCLLQVSLPGHSGTTSSRFAFVSMGFAALSVFLPVKTMLYLSGAAALLFVLEANYGRVRHAAVCTLVIMSPIFEYAANVFSFPIRLQLTGWAGRIMAFTGQQVLCEGNMLTLNGHAFSVDPECMGLNMMETSLLLGIMIAGFYQRSAKVSLALPPLLLILILIAGLNIASNLFRMIAIVQFNILPGTVLHEVTGLVCLLFYVAIPAAALIKIVVQHAGKPLKDDNKVFYKPGRLTGLYLLLAAAVMLTAYNTSAHDKAKHAVTSKAPAVPGYTVERVEADILKLNNPAALIYIKRLSGFHSTEHNPMLCWKGSGYTFKKVVKSRIDGHEVYTGIVTKGNEQLYTAWWYDNARNRTISQLSWRWEVCKGGADYALVNVTCSSYHELCSSIRNIFATRCFDKLIAQQAGP